MRLDNIDSFFFKTEEEEENRGGKKGETDLQQQQQQRAVQKLVVVSFFAKIYSPEMTSQTRGKKPNSFGSIISDDDVYNFLYLLK